MKTRTLIVDSSFLFKRSFNGAKETYNSHGTHLGGLYGYLTKLRMLIKKHGINKIIATWDGQNSGAERFRLDGNYKTNRKSKDWYNKIELSEAEIKREKEKETSTLFQIKRIQEYLENLFVHQIEISEIEADDLIAAYVLKYHEVEELFIYTNDRDFSQLLDLNLTIIFANIDTPVTKTNYMMYFDHHYSNALTLKIICGDTSDNIKGVKGLQPEGLIKYFPELTFKHLTVREICQRAREINNERVVNKQKPLKALENLLNSVDRLVLNYKLVNLREPMLNDDAKEELEQLAMPLLPEGRSSQNLLKLMNEDEFLSIYGSTFVQYVEPFYTVIMSEKDLYNEYKRKNNGRA
jgi:5'-3' exonuclease